MKKEQQVQELTKATKGTKEVKTKLEERIEQEEKVNEAMAALQVLGYNKKEIEKAFDKLAKDSSSVDMNIVQVINEDMNIDIMSEVKNAKDLMDYMKSDKN